MAKNVLIIALIFYTYTLFSQEQDRYGYGKYNWLTYSEESTFDQLGDCEYNVLLKVDTINMMFIGINNSFKWIKDVSFGRIIKVSSNTFQLSTKSTTPIPTSIMEASYNEEVPDSLLQVILINKNEKWNSYNDAWMYVRTNGDTIEENWTQIKDTMYFSRNKVEELQIIAKTSCYSFSRHLVPKEFNVNQIVLTYENKFYYGNFREIDKDLIIFQDDGELEWKYFLKVRSNDYQLKQTSQIVIDETSSCLEIGNEVFEELKKIERN